MADMVEAAVGLVVVEVVWWWSSLEEEGGGGEDIADSWRASYDSGTAAAGPCLIIDPTISRIP